MVLVVFFSTIAPVYANFIVPIVKSAFNQSQQITYAGHEMPCHDALKKGALQKAVVNKSIQELCFQHCLQYLNEPCVISARSDVSIEKSQKSPAKFMSVDVHLLHGLHFDIMSLTDPPKVEAWDKPTKGIPALLLQTSRLRN